MKMKEPRTQEILPPTHAQTRKIAELCRVLGYQKPIEERMGSQAEAGKMIRELSAEVKFRREKAK